MANKKTTNKKNNSKKTAAKKRVVKKTTVAPKKKAAVKKVETKVDPKEVTRKFIKDFIVLVIVLISVFGMVYLLTVGARKLGWFDERYTAPSVDEASISYEYIEASSVLPILVARKPDNSLLV